MAPPLVTGGVVSGTAALRIVVLGRFRLVCADREVQVPVTVQRLLALLAVCGPLGRPRVVARLWPDADERHARAALRTALWRVRTAGNGSCADVLDRDEGVLRLAPDVVVDLDALRGQELPPTGATPTALRTWLDGEGGELLPDWPDEWLVVERERVRQHRLHRLEQLVRVLMGQGEFAAAVDAALACLALDSTRESAHRLLIAVHLAEGTVAEARRAYDRCRRWLWDELGVFPRDETRALVDGPPRQRPAASTSGAVQGRG